MAALLQAAWKSPYSAEFISSMPLVGMDGTMRKRLKRTAMTGEGHIKTGTLNTVRAIAGFSRDSNGNTWAVAAILNDPKPWGHRRCWIRCCWIFTGSRRWEVLRRLACLDRLGLSDSVISILGGAPPALFAFTATYFARKQSRQNRWLPPPAS